MVADISDIFDLLDRFDLAVAQDQPRNYHDFPAGAREPIPAAFPLLNSGVMAVRKTTAVTAFLHKWQAAMLAESAQFDQPILREMLFCDGPHFTVLPPEYNLMSLHLIPAMNADDPAPRIIHSQELHCHIGSKKRRIGSLEDLLGREKFGRLALLRAADRILNPGNNPAWFGQPAYAE